MKTNLETKLKKGIKYVFAANLLNMIFNLTTSFLLPKFLAVETYASIKTFQLYVNYIGVLHLGYIDGIYLKYGGKGVDELNNNDIAVSLSTVRIFELVVAIVALGFSVTFHNTILFAFSLAILPLNMISYFRMLFQAIGEFKVYGHITNLMSVLTFLANISLLFFVKNSTYDIYLMIYVLVDIFIWTALEIFFNKGTKNRFKIFVFSFCELRQNIKAGFALMCGNFASFMLTGMDRWFVKILMDNISFAQYSFAVSIENMLNMIVTPVTIPLYNYFCKERSDEKILYVLKIVEIFAIYLISIAFIVKFPVELLLKDYSPSMNVVFLLFAAQAFQIILKAIYVNLYKVQKKQSYYMAKLIMVLIGGVAFNIVCYLKLHTKEAFAWGTLFSAIFWFMITIPDFHNIKWSISEMLCFNLSIIIFLICGFCFNAVTGFLIYIIAVSILVFTFMHKFAVGLVMQGYCMLFKHEKPLKKTTG